MKEKEIIVEFTSTSMRYLVGYLDHGKPVILYANSKSYPTNAIKAGNVVDLKSLIDFFKKESHIEDAKAKVRLNITHAIIILPSIDLKFYKFQRNVTCQSEHISEADVYSVLNAGYKDRKDIPNDSSVVSVILESYDVDGHSRKEIKIGEDCDMFGITTSLYTLPVSLINPYKAIFESNSVIRDGFLVSSYCIGELLNYDGNYPDSYIYVDIGADVVNVSLIDDVKVLKNDYFLFGGSYLTNSICERFHIDFKEAEKLKAHYGYDSRKIAYNPIISNYKDENGVEKYNRVSELNEICLSFFKEFVEKLNKQIIDMNLSDNLPLVFGGGAVKTAGFFEYLKEVAYKENAVLPIPLKVVGVRNNKYANLVGALISTRKNVNNMEKVEIIASNTDANNVK